MNTLFGGRAILFCITDMVKQGKEEYKKLIVKHQNTNHSVGSVILLEVILLDEEVAMYFKPWEEGKVRVYMAMTL